MTADKPTSPRSPTSGSFSQQYATALAYPTVGSPKTSKHPNGPRSQSPEAPLTSPTKSVDPRDRPGSSRTKYIALPPQPESPEQHTSSTSAVPDLELEPEPEQPADSGLPRYRSPEPVLETPEDITAGYRPRIVEDDGYKTPPTTSQNGGDFPFDIENWQANTLTPPMSDDHGFNVPPEPERPQIGPGHTLRAVVGRIHRHALVRPTKFTLPQRKSATPKSPIAPARSISTSPGVARPASVTPMSPTTTGTVAAPLTAQPTGTLDLDHIRTIRDVEESLPGGKNNYRKWYYCWQCAVWYKVTAGHSTIEDSRIKGRNHEWDKICNPMDPFGDAFSSIRGQGHMRDINNAREISTNGSRPAHYHEVRSSAFKPLVKRLERVEMGEELNKFPHTIPGIGPDPDLFIREAPGRHSRCFLDCTSSKSVSIDVGPVPGQIPARLLHEFNKEKAANPNVGAGAQESVHQAIQLLLTLLANALFTGQRGWVKLENPKFKAKIGSTSLSSAMLYMIGFGCRDGPEGLEVGPFGIDSKITEEQLAQQDRYMMRTWVELLLTLRGLHKVEKLDAAPGYIAPVETESLMIDVDPTFDPDIAPNPIDGFPVLGELGISAFDTVAAMAGAYTSQIGCDAQHTPRYLEALERLSKMNLRDDQEIQVLLATERSLNKFTEDDLEEAYNKIGFSATYAREISVEPKEAPDSEILRMHQVAMKSCTNPADRAEISQAIELIGRHRKNSEMQRLGRSGKTILTVEEAYEALSAPQDAVDDGLILQYEMAVSEYPGKTEHYRSCLEVIAFRPGYERLGLQRYLATGSAEEVVVTRNDIPAGLQNIGNTCYLNSILQYLYSIKPLREAVLNFSQNSRPVKPDVERSKRFVHQLRLLFLQLYKTEAAAVRPDEELAYLAITRPEVDQMVQPHEPGSVIDNLPTIASPSSTKVNTPEPSRPSSPMHRSASPSRSSILGKRVSQDRESSGSPGDRPKRSEGFEKLKEVEPATDSDFQMMDDEQEKTKPVHQEFANDLPSNDEPSSTSGMEMENLKLKSPEVEEMDPMTTMYQPPPGPPPLPPRPRRDSKGTLNAGLKFGLQQDSAEVLINVLSQLETAFEPPLNEDGSKGYNLIADLFSCKYRQQLIYQTAEGTFDAQTPVSSVFVHPIIGVEEEGKDLYDCLAELYLGGADIEYEGKKGHMMDLMDRFPPMLYIQMRRSQFDLATGRERKTNTHIPFKQTLAMDRYLADADPERRQRSIDITRDMMSLRGRLHALQNQKPQSVPDTFTHLYDSLSSLRVHETELGITDDLLEALKNDRKEVEEEIERVQQTISTLRRSLDDVWSESRDCEYELVSVFMHRGKTSGAGHYWTYQAHLPDHSERFFKYNDELVTEVPADEVLQDRTGSDANPALLCYVRKGKDLVDTLHREVYEMEQAQKAADVEMGETVPAGTLGDLPDGIPNTAEPVDQPLIDITDSTMDVTTAADASKSDAMNIDPVPSSVKASEAGADRPRDEDEAMPAKATETPVDLLD